MPRIETFAIVATTLSVALACTEPPIGTDAARDTESESETDPEMGTETGNETEAEVPAPFDLEIEWSQDACPEGFITECASVEVPLDWSGSNDETIHVLLARSPSRRVPATGQLWLVMGGPGDSADLFADEGLVGALSLLAPEMDVYVMEHRGVGESTWLGCENLVPALDAIVPDEASLRECLAELEERHGDRLRHMSSRGAASDMHALIEHNRAPQQHVVIYGVSYGTMLVQRYLQLFPEGADAVVLDSLFAPGAQFMDDYDMNWDRVAQAISDRCETDATCASKLGPNVWSRVGTMVGGAERRKCRGVQWPEFDLAWLWFTMLDSNALREHVLPLLYRIERCADPDVVAVNHYFEVLGELLGDPSPRSSDILRVNITYNEEWGPSPPSTSTLLQRCDEAVFCPQISTALARAGEYWPRYEEPLAHRFPDFDLPVLVMQGDLDAKTPVWTARTIQNRLTRADQHYVEFVDGTHAVIANSFTDDGSPIPCGVQLLSRFATQPGASLDLGCVDAVSRLDFVGESEENATFFGVPDRWENE